MVMEKPAVCSAMVYIAVAPPDAAGTAADDADNASDTSDVGDDGDVVRTSTVATTVATAAGDPPAPYDQGFENGYVTGFEDEHAKATAGNTACMAM